VFSIHQTIRNALAGFALALAMATPFQAAALTHTIIQPVSVSTDMGQVAGFDINRSIDQSGLSVGYTAGVTLFDDYLLNVNLTHSFSLNTWISTGSAPGSVTFDLGSVRNIDRMAMWGSGGFFSVANFGLSTSETETGIFASLGLFLQDFQTGADAAQVFAFAPTFARFIRMDITDSYFPNNASAGIGEVIFRDATPIPLPPAAFLLLGALGAVGVMKRRAGKAA
jgi:hypothetical protein